MDGGSALSARSRAERLLAGLPGFPERLGLETTRRLLAALGRPERRLATVLVAGTNGKGSTATLLAGMATAAGYRTGLYTSPHLESVEERLRIDGRAIDGDELADELAAVLAVEGEPPTYFEALTAAALSWFVHRQVEIAVLEVGMGGRLDATNAVEPVLSLVTQIALDHAEHLGSSLEAIATEKAGVMRRGRPVLARVGERAAMAALERAAARAESRLEEVDPRAVVWRRSRRGGQRVRIRTAQGDYRVDLALAGRHQADNLLLAVRGAETLAALGWARVDRNAVEAGAARSRWPGRLESVPLPGGREVLLDGAHNAAAARALGAHLAAGRRRWHLLFGALADKEVERMLPPLAAGAEHVVLTEPPSSRALPVAELARRAPGLAVAAVHASRPARALDQALAALPAGGCLVVAGSLYLVGAIRGELGRRFGRPAPATAALFDGDASRSREGSDQSA